MSAQLSLAMTCLLAFAVNSISAAEPESSNVVVDGATPGGIAAALGAANRRF